MKKGFTKNEKDPVTKNWKKGQKLRGPHEIVDNIKKLVNQSRIRCRYEEKTCSKSAKKKIILPLVFTM